MTYFIIVAIGILILISRLFIKDKLSKIIITIYVMWWGIWLFLSTFNFYDLFSVRISTYLLLMLNVVMFVIGFLFCGALRKKNKTNLSYINEKLTNHSVFFKILILVVIILLYYYLRYKNVVNSNISSNIRMERFTVGNVFSSSVEILFFNYFIESFVYATTIILAYMIVYGEVKNITFIFIVLSVLLYAGIGSGRGPIIDVLIAILPVFCIRSIDLKKKIYISSILNKIGKTKKIKFINILFIIFSVLIVFIYSAWLTASRMGYSEFNLKTVQIGWNEFLKQCIVYYTGPFRALDYGLELYPKSIEYLLVRGTFAGIDDIISMILKIIGITYTSSNEIIGNLLQNTTIMIGYKQTFNYAYTSLMVHYFDLGVLGIIIFPFLYGFFVRKTIFLYERKPTIPTLIIMVFLFNTMINSVFSWKLQSAPSNILLIGCYIWYILKYQKPAKKRS